MGIQVFLLDSRQVTLSVGNLPHRIGTLRTFAKITEIDDERKAEINAAREAIAIAAAPIAVMIAEVSEMCLATDTGRTISAHLVLGWDADRSHVTDFEWDYLPILGYAIRTADLAVYALHEERGGLLYPMSRVRAIDLNILDDTGELIRQGQTPIAECRSVSPYFPPYVEADCILTDGRAVEILTSIKPGNIPSPAWYKGRRPVDAATYPADGDA